MWSSGGPAASGTGTGEGEETADTRGGASLELLEEVTEVTAAAVEDVATAAGSEAALVVTGGALELVTALGLLRADFCWKSCACSRHSPFSSDLSSLAAVCLAELLPVAWRL